MNFLKQSLKAFGESIKAAGAALKAVWQAARTRLAILLAAARQKAAAAKTVVKSEARAFWTEFKAPLGWIAVGAYAGVVLTATIIWLGFNHPAIRRWVADLMAGTMQLPAGYALTFERPTIIQATVETISSMNQKPTWQPTM